MIFVKIFNNRIIIIFGHINENRGDSNSGGLGGHLVFPISFTSFNIGIVGTCYDGGDLLNFNNHNQSGCDFQVFDRLLNTWQYAGFFYVGVGY